jgi:hypothetical protein
MPDSQTPSILPFFRHISRKFNMSNPEKTEGQEVDIYRDTPVRFLGYANEVGEAFRALIHVNWVRATYGVASIYVLVSYTFL